MPSRYMSLRALKPRSVRLVPCQLDSPAPIAMPEALRNTSDRLVAARSSITCRVVTFSICGVSITRSVNFASAGSSAL